VVHLHRRHDPIDAARSRNLDLCSAGVAVRVAVCVAECVLQCELLKFDDYFVPFFQ